MKKRWTKWMRQEGRGREGGKGGEGQDDDDASSLRDGISLSG